VNSLIKPIHHKKKYSFLQSAHEDQKERLFYAFSEYLEHNFRLIKSKERTRDLLRENFD